MPTKQDAIPCMVHCMDGVAALSDVRERQLLSQQTITATLSLCGGSSNNYS